MAGPSFLFTNPGSPCTQKTINWSGKRVLWRKRSTLNVVSVDLYQYCFEKETQTPSSGAPRIQLLRVKFALIALFAVTQKALSSIDAFVRSQGCSRKRDSAVSFWARQRVQNISPATQLPQATQWYDSGDVGLADIQSFVYCIDTGVGSF